jgi:hypothetical protein
MKKNGIKEFPDGEPTDISKRFISRENNCQYVFGNK